MFQNSAALVLTETESPSTRTHADPFLTAYAAFRAAEAAFERADEARSAIVEKANAAEPHAYYKMTAWPALWLGNAWKIETNKAIDKHLASHLTGFPNLAAHFGPKTARRIRALKRYARDELRAMLAQAIKDQKKRQDDAGYTRAEEKVRAAGKVWNAAQARAITTKPTTAEGRVAYLKFAAEYLADGTGEVHGYAVLRTVAAIGRAAGGSAKRTAKPRQKGK